MIVDAAGSSLEHRPVRIGLVGLGDAGSHHARALRYLSATGQAELAAVCATNASTLQQRLRDLELPSSAACFASLEDLLASDCCDAVILATPDGLHVDQIVACARQGRHILVEKPLALSWADAQLAVAAARQHDVLLHVGYHLRYHAAHQQVIRRRDELIGPLRSLSVRWAWPDPATHGWRALGQGARFWSLAALGTHALDLCQWFAGAPIAQTVGLTVPSLADGVDRSAELAVEFASGVLAHISVAVTHRALPRLLLVGEHGEVECLATLGSRGTGEIWHRPLRGSAVSIHFVEHDPYRAQLGAWMEAIRRHSSSAPDNGAATSHSTADVIAADLGAALENVRVLDALRTGTSPATSVNSRGNE